VRAPVVPLKQSGVSNERFDHLNACLKAKDYQRDMLRKFKSQLVSGIVYLGAMLTRMPGRQI